ncbi:zinc finger protein 257 [Pieris rapae]|uniref:zinc finger protein 257 n=1 Tax=Pieris rapae TaxID=64459 RepID=UPI001E27CBF9|nr:zinc finger protein 257 [Pieris rapae]
MNTHVCINCNNKKTINHTDNRLVTESCGHVKCMDCLLQEKSGCVACSERKISQVHGSKLEATELIDASISNSDDKKAECNDLNSIAPETGHIKVETDMSGIKYYLCTICNKKLQTRKHTIYHAYCNGQKKPYQCTECNQGFVSQSHYKYHMRVHRNEKIYPCDVCGSSFVQMSKLKRHKLKHSNERTFSCPQCGKSFNNATALRKHSLTHSEEKPFACETCGKKFRDKSNYRKHLMRHRDASATQEGPRGAGRSHQCPRCPRAFHSRKDMRRHLAVHTDSKPFRCKLCERQFRRKDNLERHIRNTHPEVYAPSSAVLCESRAPEASVEPEVTAEPEASEEPAADARSILEANNARRSVIVEKRRTAAEAPKPVQEDEYVHKIRKAVVPLPPIDQEKFQSVRRGIPPEDPAPPIRNVEIYQKILYGRALHSPKALWRRKMEENTV